MSNTVLFQLREHLPEIYDDLELFVNVLPLQEQSPAHPWGGFVININVSTSAHRDVGDKGVCAVFTFRRCEGGEIVFFEAGIVLESGDGDLVIFPSADLTHFNLHFQGLRSSLVLHSDRTGDDWGLNRNKWGQHVH